MKYRDDEQGKRVVLVVEDELINRRILGKILEEEYRVLYAENGVEALEILRENTGLISMVLLDLFMPEMDGFEVLNIMEADEALKQIPVIVLTSEKNVEVQCLEKGASDFIKKPYDMPEVIRARIRRTIQFFEDRNFIEATEKDELTGLYTKTFFYRYAESMDRYYPNQKTDAVILNVEHFHLVNEIYGRAFGDQVLVRIANVVRSFLADKNGIACRTDGDNFFLYLAHTKDYDRLLSDLQEDFRELSVNLHLRIRLGVYDRADHGIPIVERFSDARFACNTLRGNYTRLIAYYDLSLRERSLFIEHITNDIHEALENNQILVTYQPVYDITKEEPKLYCVEALARWDHPIYGMLKPESFLPTLEQNGEIHLLDHYVLEEGLRQLSLWRKELPFSFLLSVNISRLDLYDRGLIRYLREQMEQNALKPKDLVLEISETSSESDHEQFVEAVRRLRAEGFTVELDGFGSGFSSIHSLSTTPVDILSLDHTFLPHLESNERAKKLASLIMEYAVFAGIRTCAEGVETAGQFDALKEMGCKYLQGNYFTKPLSEEEFTTYLMDMQDDNGF